jgi:hypothetical protein
MTELPTEKPRQVIGIDNIYFYIDFLQEVEQEIQKKAFMVHAGLDAFSKTESFVYALLEARGYFSVLPEPTSEETPDDD